MTARDAPKLYEYVYKLISYSATAGEAREPDELIKVIEMAFRYKGSGDQLWPIGMVQGVRTKLSVSEDDPYLTVSIDRVVMNSGLSEEALKKVSPLNHGAGIAIDAGVMREVLEEELKAYMAGFEKEARADFKWPVVTFTPESEREGEEAIIATTTWPVVVVPFTDSNPQSCDDYVVVSQFRGPEIFNCGWAYKQNEGQGG